MITQFLNIKVCFLLIILASGTIKAQGNKNEVEKSIRKAGMPEKALELLVPILENATMVNYFYETDGERETYEAKLKWKQRVLSIEFSETGKLLDIEEVIGSHDIEEKARESIAEFFKKSFDKHKHLRIQRQYTGEDKNDDDDEEIIKDFMEDDMDDIVIKYEMVSQIKSNKEFGTYEFLFDAAGDQLKKRRVERRSADNLIY